LHRQQHLGIPRCGRLCRPLGALNAADQTLTIGYLAAVGFENDLTA
jgi:hypothetical protein